MKELTTDVITLENYGITVNKYLTYAQVQQIVNSALHCESWAEQQQTIDMLMLYHAANIPLEELEELGHDKLLQSGLIDVVKENVRNYYQIFDGIKYTTSTNRALGQIFKQISELLPTLEKVVKRGKSAQNTK